MYSYLFTMNVFLQFFLFFFNKNIKFNKKLFKEIKTVYKKINYLKI